MEWRHQKEKRKRKKKERTEAVARRCSITKVVLCKIHKKATVSEFARVCHPLCKGNVNIIQNTIFTTEPLK